MSSIDAINLQIKQISYLTKERYEEVKQIGVLGGLSGIALFHFYYSKYLGDNVQSDIGVEILTHCISKINEGYAYPTYCNGIAGFGWTLQHLTDEGFIELDLDELLTPLDPFLQSQMKFDLDNKNFDFLHGAMGYGFYFLKRFLGSRVEKTKIRYKELLEQLVARIEQLGVFEDDTVKWESILNHEKGNKGFNLSLSHGMSSIIYLLSKLYFVGIEKDKTSRLIHGASNYILRTENTTKSGISMYPDWVEPGKNLNYNSRLSWCYGDIGIGFALEWASKVLEDITLNEKAQKIFMNTCKRRIPKQTLVIDPGYCHGSFGNAHIFHILNLTKKETAYKKAVEYWIQDGLNKHTGLDQEPYKQRDPKNQAWRFDLGLLEGVSGIGLSLIDYLSNSRNGWDECLMMR